MIGRTLFSFHQISIMYFRIEFYEQNDREEIEG